MIYKQLFSKINLLSDMALSIASFVESQGAMNFVERLDLTCGAIPPGDYEHVIDQSAPEVFLQLYQRMAEHRFAFAVTESAKMHPAFMNAITEYCYNCGKSLKPAKLPTVQAAYDLINTYVLDGMPSENTKNITVAEPNKIVWEKLSDTHEEAWKKVDGDVGIYYQLQNQFIQGLLEGSNIKFENQQNKVFTISA